MGLRTMEGPFHCNSVPVRRCPDVNFRSDGQLIYTKKTFHQGSLFCWVGGLLWGGWLAVFLCFSEEDLEIVS